MITTYAIRLMVSWILVNFIAVAGGLHEGDVLIRQKRQGCPVPIPDNERRDCYPWPDATQALCEARGCVWCPTTPGDTWCFYNDKVCSSNIPEGSRVDCLPGDPSADKNKCNQAGCLWCETATPGVPFCFRDANESQGGNRCPTGLQESERVDCFPETNPSQEECLARGCFWCKNGTEGAPWCLMPKENGYRLVGLPVETPKGWSVSLQRKNTPSLYGGDVTNIQLDVEFHTTERLRLKFFDPASSRFEVPLQIESPPSKPAQTLYDVFFSSEPAFSVRVVRKSTGATVFDTSIGGLVFSDQYLQIATYLNSPNIYGFGEHEHHTYRHDLNWKRWGMYSHGQPVTTDNLYGVQPFYMNVETSHDTHAVLLLNSNAQDITLQPHPALTYRTIGGILDLYFFFGPSPEDVVRQYTGAVGFPMMIPYWSLGFHLCRFGYDDLNAMKAAVDRTRQYNIPHDVQYGDIDYMDRFLDFTIDPVDFAELPQYVQELKMQGTRFVIILDPGISNQEPPVSYPPYDLGTQMDVWIKNADGNAPAEGRVWPGITVYPDYHKAITQTWWTDECRKFYQRLEYGGLWIDMNEPSNFQDGSTTGCADNQWNSPLYMPRIQGFLTGNLFQKTLCSDYPTEAGLMYDTHSLYGWSMARQSLSAARAATGLRSVVFSRSTFPGAGKWGQHWLGDNRSDWDDLRYSIIGILEFNIFGIPYVGADICGFLGDTDEELCTRWQQLGSFYTFSRNHNSVGNADQDPGMWPEVARITRETLAIRYTLMPYLYTLFDTAHQIGGTVLRPLLHEFVQEAETLTINEQFLWGPAFLISPVLYQGATTVQAFFPNARWYSYYDGGEVPTRADFVTLSAPIDFIPVHIRGGYILPTQTPSNSTMFSRLLPMGLIVALDDSNMASGNLFWDDGESIDTHEQGVYLGLTFSAASNSLSSTVQHNNYSGAGSLHFEEVLILGSDLVISSVTVNGQPHGGWRQDANGQIVISSLNMPINVAFTVAWN